MAILRPYKVNSYRRICDVCGRPRQIEDIRFADNVAICKIHPDYRTAQQLNAINARVRPIRLLPVPQPKPFAPIDTYTAEEAEIFNFVCRVAPAELEDVTVGNGTVRGGPTLPALTWALVYLTGLLIENKRPAAWMSAARTRALTLASTLLSAQVPYTDASPFVGAFNPVVLSPFAARTFTAADAGLGLLALVRLYTITGNETYIRAAKLTAGFIVTLQASDLLVAGPETAWGPPQNGWDDNDGEYLGIYRPGDLVCYLALNALKAAIGDVVIGPAFTAGFSGNPSRLISISMSQMRAFWQDGAVGIVGFSGATPRVFFIGSPAQWITGTIVTSDWAAGLWSLAEVEGASDQVVDVWTHLRSLTNTVGMDATLAPPSSFQDSAAVAGSRYDWASAGLMASTTTLKDRAALKAQKDTIAVPRPRFTEATPRSGDYLYLGPLGLSGASFQPVTSGTATRQRSVVRASQVSLMYREQPQGFTGQGHA